MSGNGKKFIFINFNILDSFKWQAAKNFEIEKKIISARMMPWNKKIKNYASLQAQMLIENFQFK
jgi:hypothetical protein